MECIVAILVSLAYWTGFFVAYFMVFKPYDNPWGGWIKSAGLSAVWFMGLATQRMKGLAEGKTISQIVKNLLSS